MKFWNRLLCVINLALVILITIELIKKGNLWSLLFVALVIVPMLIFEWVVTWGVYKRKK